MRYKIYSGSDLDPRSICLLVPTINSNEIQKTYVDPYNIDKNKFIAIDLYQDPLKKKTSVSTIKEYVIQELVPTLDGLNIKYVLVADSEYFKVLAGVPKSDTYAGYVLDSQYGNWKVIYVPNYKAMFYDPEKVKAKIDLGMNALLDHINGSYKDPGIDIIKFAEYPRTNKEIKAWLDKLLAMKVPLSIDIETFDLKHYNAGIGSITFCWSKHEGIAFPVDYEPIKDATKAPYGIRRHNKEVRRMLKEFFLAFDETALYHNISFDAYVLIYQLFMEDLIDTEGMLNGMDVMLRNWDCTKLITYLATNSCAGNKLSLKDQAQEFSGNWGIEEIKDITAVSIDDLLQYNLIDGLSTWYVYEKHWDTLIKDQQLDIYQGLFKDSILDIVQMQLTGMPLNMNRVLEVKAILEADEQAAINNIQSSSLVQKFVYKLNEDWVEYKNQTLKKKRVTIADAKEVFNPNSGQQLQKLLYEMLELPIIELTDTKQASTSGSTLKALKNHTKDPLILDLLNALLDYANVSKILTAFIPAMVNAPKAKDGWHYLFGSFNLGGTVSGRLSSSNINLQQLPAGGKYGKLIKSCFQAPFGWIFSGLDFSSLEDRISALLTKDNNKLKVYLELFDGHCLRAYSYSQEQMPDIDPDSVESINSIADKYPLLRQESKVPTFLLTYGGTHIGLMKKAGFSKEKALLIEQRYHELYKESDDWVAAKIEQASKDGYVTVAFGLRVRTPLLAQVIRGNSRTPYEAEAEGRTAGNALGQSYGLLNSRACNEFMGKVRKSQYRKDIRICSQIHDASYYLIRDDIDVIKYTNEHLVKAVEWQEDPAIAHPDVKLGGNLSLFYPSWAEEIELPKNATAREIIEIVNKALQSP